MAQHSEQLLRIEKNAVSLHREDWKTSQQLTSIINLKTLTIYVYQSKSSWAQRVVRQE